MSEEVIDTPLEIVAFGGNTKAFDLLSPHYEENTKKQIAQLLIWALTDKAPSAAFILLFNFILIADRPDWGGARRPATEIKRTVYRQRSYG